MSDFKEMYEDIKAAAEKHGWATAVANEVQQEPEQWTVILTKQDPAQALFQTLGVSVQDGIKSEDRFGDE